MKNFCFKQPPNYSQLRPKKFTLTLAEIVPLDGAVAAQN